MNRLSWKRIAEDVFFRCRSTGAMLSMVCTLVVLVVMELSALRNSACWATAVPILLTLLLVVYRGDMTPPPMLGYLPLTRAQQERYMNRTLAVKVAEAVLLTLVWDALAYCWQPLPWRNLVLQLIAVPLMSGCLLVYDQVDAIEQLITEPSVIVGFLATILVFMLGGLLLARACAGELDQTRFQRILAIIIIAGLGLVPIARRSWRYLRRLLLDCETFQEKEKKA